VKLNRNEIVTITGLIAGQFTRHDTGRFTVKDQINVDKARETAKANGYFLFDRRGGKRWEHECWLERIPEYSGIGQLFAAISEYAEFLRRGDLTFEQSSRVIEDTGENLYTENYADDWNRHISHYNISSGNGYLVFTHPNRQYITPAGPTVDRNVSLAETHPGRDQSATYRLCYPTPVHNMVFWSVQAYERWDNGLLALLSRGISMRVALLPSDTQVEVLPAIGEPERLVDVSIRRRWGNGVDISGEVYPDNQRGSSIRVSCTILPDGAQEPKMGWYSTIAPLSEAKQFHESYEVALFLGQQFYGAEVEPAVFGK
jgi:hypothetical protein